MKMPCFANLWVDLDATVMIGFSLKTKHIERFDIPAISGLLKRSEDSKLIN